MKPDGLSQRFAPSVAAMSLGVLLALPAGAQQTPPPAEGINSGNYNIKQTLEVGYRWTGFTGNRSVFNTFVNLNPGPRLLEHTLQMRSLDHAGRLFDDFFASSFGYGGDPNNVTRLRVYKNKAYNLTATYRRDRNFWDYNLLANPLNPVLSNPVFIVPYSPHRFEVTRRMTDVNLTLFPQSRLRLRFGYARNRSEGPSLATFQPLLATFQEITVLLFQHWNTLLNSYQFAVDVKPLPKTNISYDQFLQFHDGETSWFNTVGSSPLSVPLFFAQLSNGTAVDLGLVFNSPASRPCSPPVLTSPGTVPPTVKDTCNGYLQYTRSGNVRAFYPTEQLSFQSNYFKTLDLSGRLAYSSSETDVDAFAESFQGLLTRTQQRQFDNQGAAKAKRVSVSVDFGATLHVTEKLRLLEMFRFAHFRIPGRWDSVETSLFPAALPASLLGSTASFPAAIPQHNTVSPADNGTEVSHQFLGQDLKSNLFEVQYDFTERFSVRLGYRFQHRAIIQRVAEEADLLFLPTLVRRGACAPLRPPAPPNTLPGFCVTQPDGSIRGTPSSAEEGSTTIQEHSALLGIWARPIDALQLNFDLELTSADNSFTRISPRHLQHYRLRGSYKPVHWASFAASLNIIENRNNVFQVENRQHDRAYSFTGVLEPDEKWTLDFGYDYSDLFSTTFVCYPISPNISRLPPCFAGAGLFADTSFYKNRAHYGYFNLSWQPVSRIRIRVGYNITSTAGATLLLPLNAPAGPLALNYHRPCAGFAVDLARGFTFKADWGYYSYNEKTPAGTTGPRDFRGNLVTTSLRFAF